MGSTITRYVRQCQDITERSREATEKIKSAYMTKRHFTPLQDADAQIKKYLKKSNDRPIRPLGYLSPNDIISILLNV